MGIREQIPHNDMTEELKQAERLPFFAGERGKNLSVLFLLVIVVVIVHQSGGSTGAVMYEMDRQVLGVACRDYPAVLLQYGDIEDIEKVDTFNMGRPIDTADWDFGWCGTFENQEYGVYTLFAYSGTGEYIVVHHSEGVLIFNQESAKRTNAVYEALTERWHSLSAKEDVS